MGAGLSMASVNKIKELANAREYSLALEIVDSQDLSKSLNPQFLRLCGDIYSHAGRYKDARRVLVMAHRLAPESKRIIFSLMELHLNAGHEELAKRYYDIYLFGSDDSIETKQAKYMYDNAHGKSAETLIEYLEAAYMHSMDYDWSFITYLLLIKLGRKSDADALADVYCATYKSSENSDCIGKIAAGEREVDSLIYTFAKEWVEDNAEDESEVREQELKLIENDELRIHPKEAEITIMFDEVGDGTEELSKRKMKKLLKEHEKQERELEEKERLANEEGETEAQDDETVNSDNKKTGLFKKLFKKSKMADEDSTEEIIVEQTAEEGRDKTEEAEKAENVEKVEETEKVEEAEKIEETEKVEEAEKVEEIEKTELKSDEASDNENTILNKDSVEEAEDKAENIADSSNDDVKQTKKYKFNIEEALLIDDSEQEDENQLVEDYIEDNESQNDWENDTLDDGETNMSGLHLKENEVQSDLIVSVDEENDGFAAEADTIDDLSDEADYNDASDNIDSEKSETEKFFSKKKMEYVFEASDIIVDDDEDAETDDFTVAEDDEFGLMSVEDEDETENASEAEAWEEVNDTFEAEAEEEINDTFEAEAEEETEADTEQSDFEFDFEFDAENEQEKTESEIKEENVVDAEEESVDSDEDADFEFDFEFEAKTEEKAENTEDTSSQPDEEDTIEVKETESYSEADIEKEVETEIEVETEQEEPDMVYEAEQEEPDMVYEAEQEEPDTVYEADEKQESELEPVQEQTDEKSPKPDLLADLASKKSNIDFPVFKTDLFPEYNVVEVENNFDEIMEKAQDKLQANLLKEEQMQREAEALLASLGIDYGSVTPKKQVEKAVRKPDNTINNTASRDALKASLKISSEKREILRKIKEHR